MQHGVVMGYISSANKCTFHLWVGIICLFGVFTQSKQYFSYFTATVYKSMFPGLFLTSTKPAHYPDIGGPVVVLFP